MDRNNPWVTKVVAEYFNILMATFIPHKVLLQKDKKYIYKLTYNMKDYILKGFTLNIPWKGMDYDKYKNGLYKVFKKIHAIYSEYYIAKAASPFNIHISKSLAIDHKLSIQKEDSQELSTYVIEILQDHGGQPLDQIAKTHYPLSQIFNYMYQSACALSFLHHAGIAHMDLKPANMVYDSTDDILRMIDFGSSTSATESIKLHKVTTHAKNKLRELTVEYAAPEILKKHFNPSLEIDFMMSSVDVYCWGMTFYSMLMEKSSKDLASDIELYKKKDRGQYELFLKKVENEFDKYKLGEYEDIEILNWVKAQVLKSFAYLPIDRPNFDDICSSLTERLKLQLPYIQKAMDEKLKLFEKICWKGPISKPKEHFNGKIQNGEAEETIAQLNAKINNLEQKLQNAIDELNEEKKENTKLKNKIELLEASTIPEFGIKPETKSVVVAIKREPVSVIVKTLCP